jgi:hypothetical protein
MAPAALADPVVPDSDVAASPRRIMIGLAPGGLLLLGAMALLGSGSFLEALRSSRP